MKKILSLLLLVVTCMTAWGQGDSKSNAYQLEVGLTPSNLWNWCKFEALAAGTFHVTIEGTLNDVDMQLLDANENILKETDDATDLEYVLPSAGIYYLRIYKSNSSSFTVTSVTIPGVESHVHTPSPNWSYDSTNHWHDCINTVGTCDTPQLDFAEHSYTFSTSDKCTVCQRSFSIDDITIETESNIGVKIEPYLNYSDATVSINYSGYETSLISISNNTITAGSSAGSTNVNVSITVTTGKGNKKTEKTYNYTFKVTVTSRQDGSYENPYILSIGDNEFRTLSSGSNSIWYKMYLNADNFKMFAKHDDDSFDKYSGTLYRTDGTTILKSVSNAYFLEQHIPEEGWYYFECTWSMATEMTLAYTDGETFITAYPLTLGVNNLYECNKDVFYYIDLDRDFYIFTPSSGYSFQIYEDFFKEKIKDSNESSSVDHSIADTFFPSRYYVKISQCPANQTLTITKHPEWDDIAILGNFPNSGWDEPRVPLYLATKLETNKFCGTIDASNWQNTTYDFKLYNEENLGAETNYWGNNQTISFANSNTANFHEGNDNDNNHWVHNTTYKAYYVVAEYKYSVSDNSFYWDVNVTGIPAGVYFPGTWNDWVPADDNVKLDGSSYLTLTLEANTDYQFKIFDTNGCNWFGCEEAITADNTGNPRQFILTSGEDRTSDNCTIRTGLAGNYVFHITAWDNNQPSQPSLEVKYPSYAPKTLTLVAKDDDTYYATFSNDMDVIFASENANVRVVTAENLKLSMETVDMFNDAKNGYSGYSVPANTGVLISSTSSSLDFFIVEGQTITSISKNNMLHPKSDDMDTLEGDYLFYKLAYGDWTNKTRLGFYWGADNGGPFSIKDGTAYLAVPTNLAGQVKSFVFKDEETDGINSVNNGNSAKDDHIYNLNGQRISLPTRGQLYIKNGKTYIGE